MRNDKFWNECSNGSIRKKIAEFIDNSPTLSSFKGNKFYKLEDELVEFIEENRHVISVEVDKEYQRDDLKKRAIDGFGKDTQIILKVLPIEVLDDIIDYWQECFMDEDDYWYFYWSTLEDTMSDSGISPVFFGVENYKTQDLKTYAAYLEDWYKNHTSRIETPVCIDEFFDNEALDDEILKTYIEKAKDLFGKDDKPATEEK